MKQTAPLRIISYLAIGIYIFFGIYLLVKANVISAMSPNMQKGFGIILLLYGLFRLRLIIQRMRFDNKRNRTNEEQEV